MTARSRRQLIELRWGCVEYEDYRANSVSATVREWLQGALAQPLHTRVVAVGDKVRFAVFLAGRRCRRLNREDFVRGLQVVRVREQMFDMEHTITERIPRLQCRRSGRDVMERPVEQLLRAVRYRVMTSVEQGEPDDDLFWWAYESRFPWT